MLTYVINTSENRTFDSSRLFELAGYSRIRWLQCSLNEVKKCAEYIAERQNNLTADKFRIAVIVDFYGFDKIRIPYGRRGFGNDEGVDMGLYIPYIEVFLLDNLIAHLENKELYADDFEVYYVQNEKSERYELFKNATTQIKQVLTGGEGKRMPDRKELEDIAVKAICGDEFKRRENVDNDAQEKAWRKKKLEQLLQTKSEDDLTLYKSFRLHCTPTVQLDFNLVRP